MRPLPRRVYVAVIAVVCAAIAAFGVAVAVAPWQPHLVTWLIAGEIAIAVAASLLVRVPLATRSMHHVSTTAFLLAAVLLPTPLAMVEVVLAWLATDLVQRVEWTASRRVPWYDTAFNAAQNVLRVAVGASVFRAVSGKSLIVSSTSDRILFAVILAGAAMYVTNVVLLHGIISVQNGRWRAQSLVRLVRVDFVHDGSLQLLGALGAIIAGVAPLAIAVPLGFTVIIHRELSHARGETLVDLDGRNEAPRSAELTPGASPVTALVWWAS